MSVPVTRAEIIARIAVELADPAMSEAELIATCRLENLSMADLAEAWPLIAARLGFPSAPAGPEVTERQAA